MWHKLKLAWAYWASMHQSPTHALSETTPFWHRTHDPASLAVGHGLTTVFLRQSWHVVLFLGPNHLMNFLKDSSNPQGFSPPSPTLKLRFSSKNLVSNRPLSCHDQIEGTCQKRSRRVFRFKSNNHRRWGVLGFPNPSPNSPRSLGPVSHSTLLGLLFVFAAATHIQQAYRTYLDSWPA